MHNFVVLTADKVLHCTNGDVVSRSGGFGITVSRTMSISFLDEWVEADSGPFFLWEFLYRRL